MSTPRGPRGSGARPAGSDATASHLGSAPADAVVATAYADRRPIHHPTTRQPVEDRDHVVPISLYRPDLVTLRAAARSMQLSTRALLSELLTRCAQIYRTGRDRHGMPLDWSSAARATAAAEVIQLSRIRDQLASLVGSLDAATRVHRCPSCGTRYQVEARLGEP